jgi:acyl carrier protein
VKSIDVESEKVLDAIKTLLVERLKFDPARAAEITLDTALPKGIDGSLGLDSLDFIELAMGIEERCGVLIDDREDLAPHFKSVGALVDFIAARQIGT